MYRLGLYGAELYSPELYVAELNSSELNGAELDTVQDCMVQSCTVQDRTDHSKQYRSLHNCLLAYIFLYGQHNQTNKQCVTSNENFLQIPSISSGQ